MMLKTLKMVMCFLFVLILTNVGTHTSIAEDVVVVIKPQTIPDIINQVAPMFEQDQALIGKISYCESGWNKDANHDSGHGKGVSGYHKATFEESNIAYEKIYHEKLNYESSYDQLKLMSFDFSRGEQYRRAWTTYRAYANGGTYTFYSKLMQKWYTVHCK